MLTHKKKAITQINQLKKYKQFVQFHMYTFDYNIDKILYIDLPGLNLNLYQIKFKKDNNLQKFHTLPHQHHSVNDHNLPQRMILTISIVFGDYTVSSGDAYFCNKKDSTCIPGAISNGSVTCASGTLSCSAITDETVCNSGLNVGTNQICFWNLKCAAYDVSFCSGITHNNLCTKVGCLYNNSICAAKTCSSVKTSTDCNFIRGDLLLTVTACDWNNSICAELNTSTLNSTTCFGKSGGTHELSGSSCQACTSSYTMIISAFLMMTVF